MLFVIALLLLLIIFDAAAMHWGFDSRDRLENKEWERRLRHIQIRDM